MVEKIFINTVFGKAEAEINTETKEVTIFSGSVINPNSDNNSFSTKNKQLKDELIEKGVINNNIFVQNFTFKNPSTAASIIKGYSEGYDGFTLQKTNQPLSQLLQSKPTLIDYILKEYSSEKEINWTGRESLSRFRAFFPNVEIFKSLTWEKYDKSKDKTTLMYFLERQLREFGSGMMGNNSHKLFYHDKISNTYKVAEELKSDPSNKQLSDEQLFKKYMDLFYDFIIGFNISTYDPQKFIPTRNIIKAKMLHIFRPYEITSINGKPHIQEILNDLKIPFSEKDDSIKLNILLTNYLFQEEPKLKKLNIYIISIIVWEYYINYVDSNKMKTIPVEQNGKHVTCNTGLKKDDWIDFLSNSDFVSEIQYQTLQLWNESKQYISPKEMAIIQKSDLGIYRNHFNTISQKASKYFKIKLVAKNLEDVENNKSKYWPILCDGLDSSFEGNPVFAYKLKEELALAMDYLDDDKYESKIDIQLANTPNSTDDLFLETNEIDQLKELILTKKNVILKGSPGVGKTYVAKKIIDSFINSKSYMIQFHQSYSYEDFIQGYVPDSENPGSFYLKNGIFYKIVEEAKANPNQKIFLIIDEINRGNLSKIFGEILMLIEEDKRDSNFKVILSHSNEQKEFYIPSNLYLIGTMNTADRSITHIDYALRRRFSFYHLDPAFDRSKFKEHLQNSNISESLSKKVIEKMKSINQLILDDPSLGKGFEIGHSYFCNPKGNSDLKWLEKIIRFEIKPLLEEYWFDQPNKAKEALSLLES